MNRVSLVAFLCATLALPSAAQTTFGAITGVVTDATGAFVPGARVSVRHLETNAESTASTNESGVFTVPQLREGTYEVRLDATGFRPWSARAVTLASREIRRLDIRLDVGSVETAIEVTAEVALIETETARISDTKTGARLNQLPVPSRDIRRFLSLSPAVSGSRNSDSFRMSGSFQQQNDFAVDGITVNNGYTSTPIVPLMQYMESFQELRLDTANNTAEFGAIGQLSVTTKSGTNQLRGSLFDYYTTPFFRSRNPFATERPGGVVHQPGFSVGGPVILPKVYNGRDKTFFFTSFETSRGSSTTQIMNATVAPEPWRRGDFGSLVIRDPLNGNQPFPNNVVPANRLNPVSLRIQERFFPRPNFGDPNTYAVNNSRNALTYPFQPNSLVIARIDHRFNERSFFYIRGSYNRATFDFFDGALPTIGRRWNRRDTRGLNISHTQFLTNTIVNEARYGLSFNNNGRNGPLMGREVVSFLGLQGLSENLPDVNGIFEVSFQNLPLTGISQTQYRKPGFQNFVHQFQDHVNWLKGKHNVKGGVMLTRIRFDDGQAAANLFGSASFSNRFTGQPYADFLLGIPTSSSRGFPFFTQIRERWAYDFFIQDEWKVRPNLTVNAGLRYELHPQFREINGRQAIFDPATSQIGVADGGMQFVSPLMPLAYVGVVDARTLGYDGDTLIRTDRNNFAPRLGIAWRPLGPNTVIRSGFGVFYDVSNQNRVSVTTPFEITEPAYTNPTTGPDVVLPRILPAGYAGRPANVALPTAVDPNLPIPYSYQYNFTLEHQRWNTGFRTSYVGTAQRRAPYTLNINQPAADGRLFVDKPRPFPLYPAINYIASGAGHQYNAFTFEAERALKNGLQWQWSWTWARDIGDVENAAGIEDSFDRARERGVMQDVPTHRISGNAIYELPFGRGKPFANTSSRVANAIVGGWSVSAIYQFSTGDFLTASWTGPDPTGTRFTQNRTPAQVTLRPDQLRDANLDNGTLARFFDPTAFAAPQPGRFGTAARGTIIGPSATVWNGGIFKQFVFHERVRLRWELVGQNILNHANWGFPITNITNAQVGTINGTGGPSAVSYDNLGAQRELRMGLRLEW